MKFSGHETFPVREGWLHKGLKLLADDPRLFLDEEVSDYLGVGRNMAKSIKHWLQVTGLAQPSETETRGNRTSLHMTKLGGLVWENDPFFMELGTWWVLHINLIRHRDIASTWYWFFNRFGHDRFDRAVCLESLRRYIEAEQKRVPSSATIQRDLGCLLLSYARIIPATNEDPEDGADCPFRDLGLLTYFKTSGYYQLHHGIKDVSANVFCYAVSLAFHETLGRSKSMDIRLHDLARQPTGPGRAFCLSGEALFEFVSKLESESTDNQIQIAGLAGDRIVRVQNRPALEWIENHYRYMEENAHVS